MWIEKSFAHLQQVWYNPHMNKLQIVGYEYVKYPSENRKRKLAVVLCPKCSSRKVFRVPDIPYDNWICRDCFSKNHTEIINCAHCGEDITRAKSKNKNSRSGLQFCNRKCKEAEQTYGGLLELPHYEGIRNARQTAIQLAGGQCEDCGITDNWMLALHHKDKNRDNNDPSNLELLCHNHHASRHKKLVNGKWVLDCKQLFDF